MSILAGQSVLDNLPQAELSVALEQFLAPLQAKLPDKRLQKVASTGVQSLIAAQSPVITQMARLGDRRESSTHAASQRLYRFLDNQRLSANLIFEGLYQIGQQAVAREHPDYLVIAVDPVNFEKPYTKKLEGVSTVHKATPPDLAGQARLTKGYPAITASVVNTKVPVTTYANWFSYQLDFISQNWEIEQALRNSQRLFPGQRLRFGADSGFDDQKIFEWFKASKAEFVIRVSHLERKIEVYNPRLARWESERLADLVKTLPWQAYWLVEFKHAGITRLAKLGVGWFKIRLPGREQALWVLVAEEVAGQAEGRQLVLITNVALPNAKVAQQVYEDWRLRSRIEHGYRFDQEQGLDVENIQVRSLEKMRRLFGLVLAAAQFVFYLLDSWPAKAVKWIRELGGKLGLKTDREGPYIFLQGLVALYQTFLTVSFALIEPFPKAAFFSP